MTTRSLLHTRREVRRRQRRLGAVYSEPDELASWEHAERRAHRDLPDLPRAELLSEQARLRLRLVYDPDPRPWFLARARAIEEALRHAR